MSHGGSWTLEAELKELAQAQSVAEALLALHLIEDEHEAFEIVTLTDWFRGGAETYLLNFSVVTPHADRRFVMKACVAIPPAHPFASCSRSGFTAVTACACSKWRLPRFLRRGRHL